MSAMLYATEQLRRRLRLSNLDLVEPSGQDGRMCQYLAVIHQLTLHGVLSSFDGHDLEAAMINWLLEHHDDVVGYHGERGDMAEVVQLHDTWTELDFHAVVSATAQGDHNTLASILALLKTRGLHAQAKVHDWRGVPHDMLVYAHDIYDVVPFLTIHLGYASCCRGKSWRPDAAQMATGERARWPESERPVASRGRLMD